jgi:glutathione peroxidase
MNNIYEISLKTITGESTTLKQFQGKKMIIINVASQCGFTVQYAKWESFYRNNIDKIVVLGFPCNQFGYQEPKSNSEIKTFCTLNYDVTFPMFEKVNVKGEMQSALFKWLTNQNLHKCNTSEPVWNFCKYLIDEKGNLISFFNPDITPENESFLEILYS